jgi:hypothetical protein
VLPPSSEVRKLEIAAEVVGVPALDRQHGGGGERCRRGRTRRRSDRVAAQRLRDRVGDAATRRGAGQAVIAGVAAVGRDEAVERGGRAGAPASAFAEHGGGHPAAERLHSETPLLLHRPHDALPADVTRWSETAVARSRGWASEFRTAPMRLWQRQQRGQAGDQLAVGGEKIESRQVRESDPADLGEDGVARLTGKRSTRRRSRRWSAG